MLKRNQRLQYSKEQQEQKKKELFSKLPARYRELFGNIDKMKKAQLEKRRRSLPPKALRPDNSKEQIVQEPNQGTAVEPPSSAAKEKEKEEGKKKED